MKSGEVYEPVARRKLLLEELIRELEAIKISNTNSIFTKGAADQPIHRRTGQ